MTDEPGFGKETHSTYEPLPEEIAARRVTDPAAHTPDVSPDHEYRPVQTIEGIVCGYCKGPRRSPRHYRAHTPDVSTLVKTIRNGIPDDYRGPDPNDLDGEKWGPDPEVLAALDDLAATAREAEKRAGDSHEVMVRVWADRDRLARRVAELEAALDNTRAYYVLRAESAERRVAALEAENERLRKQLQLAIEQDYCTLCGAALAGDGGGA